MTIVLKRPRTAAHTRAPEAAPQRTEHLRRRTALPESTPAPQSPPPLVMTSAADIEMSRPEWLWERRIPLGAVSLLAGRGGAGKTALACWLMAQLTRGTLPGDRLDCPSNVVHIGVEDDRSTVLIPRLVAAGADIRRVRFIDASAGLLDVTKHAGPLWEMLASLDVALIVVDPLDSFLGATDSHRKSETQSAIGHFAQVAQSLRCGALGIAHLNKGESRSVVDRVVGSVGFSTAVRSLIAVGESPSEPGTRVAAVAKANMTDLSTIPAVTFRVDGTEVDAPDGGFPITTGVAVITGEIEGFDADSLLSTPSVSERTQRDEATQWLRSVLGGYTVAKKVVMADARGEGLAKSTVERAARDLGVIVTRDESERGRPSYWSLPES
jgi:hypothetical protein